MRVIVCIDAVVRERAAQALAEAEDALAVLLTKRRVLSFLLRPWGAAPDPLAPDPLGEGASGACSRSAMRSSASCASRSSAI